MLLAGMVQPKTPLQKPRVNPRKGETDDRKGRGQPAFLLQGNGDERSLADALESSRYMEQSVSARLSQIELRGSGDHYSSPA